MIIGRERFVSTVQGLSSRWLPFADAASVDLSMGRLLRLSLFQISVGMATVLLSGTLNRVMVIELDQPVWLVSLMVAIPLLLAPVRALIGFRSDHHKSYLGWRRVPYIWFGTLLQFGGFAIMPFALILMTEPHNGPAIVGPLAAMLAFILVGSGMHVVQTAGLALATDLATTETRPRVVALLYVMLLVGSVGASLGFAQLLTDFSYFRLIQVLQGTAVVTVLLNVVALWQQERRQPQLTSHDVDRPKFIDVWRQFSGQPRVRRLLVAVALGTAGFAMQDVLLEPYGADILAMTVAETTGLTALLAGGTLLALVLASRGLARGADPIRIAGYGVLMGVVAFAAVIFAAPLNSAALFKSGTFVIGAGTGLFAVGTLTSVMALAENSIAGLLMGAWGAVQVTAIGVAMFIGGIIRDGVAWWALTRPESVLSETAASYSMVYHVEILLLFAALVALGPLVREPGEVASPSSGLKLADIPG